MSGFWPIFKRELFSFYVTPLAWVVMTAWQFGPAFTSQIIRSPPVLSIIPPLESWCETRLEPKTLR